MSGSAVLRAVARAGVTAWSSRYWRTRLRRVSRMVASAKLTLEIVTTVPCSPREQAPPETSAVVQGVEHVVAVTAAQPWMAATASTSSVAAADGRSYERSLLVLTRHTPRETSPAEQLRVAAKAGPARSRARTKTSLRMAHLKRRTPRRKVSARPCRRTSIWQNWYRCIPRRECWRHHRSPLGLLAARRGGAWRSSLRRRSRRP